METIEGELEQHRIVGDDFWSLATVRTEDRGRVAVVGKLLGAHVGDTVEVDGDWNEHPRFGTQFKARECRVVVPQTDNGAVSWLAMRLPNVGKARARAMIDHFGSATKLWAAIETTPARLAEVKGVSPERVADIVDAYKSFREERDQMIRFRSWGMTENQVARMLAKWGTEAEAKLRKNPFELAESIDGFGFLRADAIAQRMGVPRDSVGRIECGLRHTMKEATGAGHCYVPTGKLVKLASEKVLRIDSAIVAKHVAIMRKRGEFIQHGKRTFTRSLNRHEQTCANHIRALLAKRTSNQ